MNTKNTINGETDCNLASCGMKRVARKRIGWSEMTLKRMEMIREDKKQAKLDEVLAQYNAYGALFGGLRAIRTDGDATKVASALSRLRRAADQARRAQAALSRARLVWEKSEESLGRLGVAVDLNFDELC